MVTNFLTETETETFYPRQIFPIPIPRLFFRDQIFRDRYRDFFSETKFSDTDTETFFPRPNFPIPIPRLLKNWQKSRDREVSRPRRHTLIKNSGLRSLAQLEYLFLQNIVGLCSTVGISPYISLLSKSDSGHFGEVMLSSLFLLACLCVI